MTPMTPMTPKNKTNSGELYVLMRKMTALYCESGVIATLASLAREGGGGWE